MWWAVGVLAFVVVVGFIGAGYELNHLRNEVNHLNTTVNGLSRAIGTIYNALLQLYAKFK
ncbi:MAG: hypothetical protein JO368_04640 [Acidimicrobiales bacterium]|nr:hypothetical protein [Acidimicrobiales bacterium]